MNVNSIKHSPIYLVLIHCALCALGLFVGIAAADSQTTSLSPDARDCPPVVFVKRQHFDRPFGIGTIIGWKIYKPGGGIYIYDPQQPETDAKEIFRRDDGVIFDMSLSFDAKKLLFAWKQCAHSTTSGPLTVSHVWSGDTANLILDPSTPTASAQKPNHSFWTRKEGAEWAQVNFSRPTTLSQIAVYWFDDQPGGGCAIPLSWKLHYRKDSQWLGVQNTCGFEVAKDTYNALHFEEVTTTGLRIELQCRADKSAGIQRWRIGTPQQHKQIVEHESRTRTTPYPDAFHIFEINTDGTGLRQLTKGPYNDIHPFYLPDGRIGFVSTRSECYTMCQPGAGCALHVMAPDGADVRRIHFGTLADHSPHLLDNGSILFTRWEYQDKDLTYLQGLWTVNPDGTRVQLFYGNTILEPAVIWQARPIPQTSKVLCTLAPHHGNPVGAVGIIDRSRGLENPAAITNLTPEIDYNPKRNARGPGDRQYAWAYRDPHPIRQDLFVVSHGDEGAKRYRLYLMDDQGRKKLLYGDSVLSCFNPLPLVPRKTPHAINPIARSDDSYGAFFVADIYRGMIGVKRGQVKAIRVMQVPPKTCNMRGQRAYDMDPLMSRGTYYAKHCLGTVSVDADGSAYFKAPAGVELYFQAIDADGKELCRMGSITQVMPGETQGCIGCHESRFSSPANGTAYGKLLSAGPADITPPPWGAGAIDFVRHVQPVFDRYCADCHSGAKPDAGIDLSGDKTRYFNMAYDTLTERGLINYYWLLNKALVRAFRPLESGARVSKLTELIENEHADVKMDDQSRRRIYTWIEANAPYYGTYDHTRPGTPGSRDACWNTKWFRDVEQIYARRCAACHGKDLHINNSGRRHTWINLTHPEFSAMLNAPLSKADDGLERCKPKDGKDPNPFDDRADADYRAILSAIRQGKRALYAKPRMDMPHARPLPYPTDFTGPFTGFAGP